MITGLHIDIKTDELRTLLRGRLELHEKKLSNYKTQLENLTTLEKGMDNEEARKLSSSQSPRQSFEEGIHKHTGHCIYYRFMVDHLVPDETYRLSESDLERIGVGRRFY